MGLKCLGEFRKRNTKKRERQGNKGSHRTEAEVREI